MQQSYALFVLISSLSYCSNNTETTTSDPYSFSCSDYQIMIDVELEIAPECTSVADCTQILLEGDLECEANSIVANSNYDSTYFFELLEEADGAGCDIDIVFPQDCSADVACQNSVCAWR